MGLLGRLSSDTLKEIVDEGVHDAHGLGGDSSVDLGTFRDGVFGQFTGKEEPDGGLDLPGGDGGPLVVVGQFGSLSSNTQKEVVAHGLREDAGVGLGTFRNGVFGHFTRKEEPDGGLNFPVGDSGPLVVVGQLGSLGSDTLNWPRSS